MTTATRIAPRNHLSAKQEAFCVFYFETRHGTNSALQAGYSPRSAYAIAEENLNKPEIQARLRELEAKVESDAIGTVSERKKRLTEIYRANLTDFVDADGIIKLKPSAALAEVTVEEHVVDGETALSVRTKRLKLRDPVAAIQEQNRMERIGAHGDPTKESGNRIIQIIVSSEKARELTESVANRFLALEGEQTPEG